MLWQRLTDWFLGLGAAYGVDPLVFGVIYVGAIPFFTLSLAWLVRNRRAGRPITLPLLSAGFFFLSAYLYLFAVGENLPVWVYALVAALLAFGAWSAVRKVRARMQDGA